MWREFVKKKVYKTKQLNNKTTQLLKKSQAD